MDQARDNYENPATQSSMGAVNPQTVGQKMKQVWKTGIAKDGRRYLDIPDEELGAMYILKNGDKGLQALGISPDDKSAEADKAKNDIVSVAKQMQQVIANKDKYDEKTYQDTLNSLASSLTLKKKEAENLGAALSGNELAILSGQTPVTQSIGGSFPQKVGAFFTGKEPVQRGEVVEDEETMRNKLALLIAGMEGQEITPEMMASTQQPKKPSGAGGLLQNAGADVASILNDILNIPKNSSDTANAALYAPDQKTREGARFALTPAGMKANALKGLLNEANELTGRPLEGGDILGRIMGRAYEKPVTTALDVLPFLASGKGAIVSRGGRAGKVTQSVDAVTAGVNPPQNLIRQLTDATRGGGSKEYIKQITGKETAVPQNKVLLSRGILSHPTETGRIQATSKALDDVGGELETLYKNSDRVFRGKQIGSILDEGLKGSGYDTKAINFIKRYVQQQGGFDLAAGDNIITMDSVWKAAQNLEKAPPKMLKNPEAAALYKELSKDTARLLRKELGDRVEGTRGLNAEYSALRDYFDTGLKDPTGPNVKQGIVRSTIEAGKDVVANPLLNQVFKLTRDRRMKADNPNAFRPAR